MIINQITGSRNAIKLASIEITKQPNKINYVANEVFNTAGMEVKAIYSNGATRIVTDYIVDSDILTPLDTSVVIKFTECGVTATTSQAINVEKISLAIPTLASGQTLTYTGSTITPTFTNYDTNYITGNGLSGVNAGTYTAAFALKDNVNYQWSDGTVTNKAVSWTINKATASVYANKTSVTLNNNTLSDTVEIASIGMSSITATSSNTSIVTVSVSGNIITINNVNKTRGTAAIILSGTPDNNYTAPNYPTISVNADFVILLTVPTPASSYYIRTGSTITPTWNNYNSSLMTIDGTTSALELGNYTATFTLKDTNAYNWSDGTSSAKSVTWSIKEDWATILKDFNYTENSDFTATITGWKGTYNGSTSTEVIIPAKTGIKL